MDEKGKEAVEGKERERAGLRRGEEKENGKTKMGEGIGPPKFWNLPPPMTIVRT
jgi:hypothetical protein